MAITYSDPDLDTDADIVAIAALTPADNAVIIGNGAAWVAESGATLKTSLGLTIGTDVQGYDADLLSWALITRAAGFDTFAATPSSANLRTLLSDESGSGALLFAGGALGTPASGVLTNCTGLPNASVVGLGTAALVADNTLVHLAVSETITGAKTFSTSPIMTASLDMRNDVRLTDSGTNRWAIGRGAGGGGAADDWQLYNYGTTSVPLRIPYTTNIAAFLNTPTVAGDPIMTRGASETITGLKTFTSQGSTSVSGNSAIALGRSATTQFQGLSFPTGVAADGAIYRAASSDNVIIGFDLGGGIAAHTTFTQGGGVVVGSPTGGDKGVGTINATAVYDDNTLLTCYVLDAAIDGAVDMAKWDAKVPDRVIPAVTQIVDDTDAEPDADGIYPTKLVEVEPEGIEVRIHTDARKFVARLGTDTDPLDIDKYADHWKTKRHLTSMPNEENFDPLAGMPTGSWIQRLIETVEIQAVHIDQLNQRLKALEAAQ